MHCVALLLVLTLSTQLAPTTAEDLTTSVKKPTSFVTPTLGSARALTLSTYLTDAADLHYAAVPAGHEPLTATAIKNAAEQCAVAALSLPTNAFGSSWQSQQQQRHASRTYSRQLLEDSDALPTNVAAANTVHVAHAQKIERCVDGLAANTSYDVYFVAEVPSSNGVFGPVQSVLQSTTHPEPPTLTSVTVSAANDAATAVHVTATLSTPGQIYFAFVPSVVSTADAAGTDTQDARSTATSAASLQLTTLDVVTNRSVSDFACMFARHDASDWSDLAIDKRVDGLESATLYDVLYVTEAVGGGAVRSDIVQLPRAVQTHALPPDVAHVAATPLDASADALVVNYTLQFDADDLQRANALNVASFAFIVHFEATRVDTSTTKSSSTTDATAALLEPSPIDDDAAPASDDDVVRGTFSLHNATSVVDLQQRIAHSQHQGVITHLRSGTQYRVVLHVETTSSNGGLVGRSNAAAPAVNRTHARAPPIVTATAAPVNGTVHALAVTVELARSGASANANANANVHYLVAPRDAMQLRHNFRDAPTVEHLMDLVRRDESEFVYGAIPFDAAAAAARPRLEGEDDDSSLTPTYATTFHVDGLRDATAYTVVVMPETVASNGVFGQPFAQLLEAQTNENASDVVLHRVEPVVGSTTSVELVVEMTKPHDVLFYCLATALPLTATMDACVEANRTTFTHVATPSSHSSAVAFTINNLTANTLYFASVFAENAQHNGVVSAATAPPLVVMTFQPAPVVEITHAAPVKASTSRAAVSVVTPERCLVHFAVIEGALKSNDDDEAAAVDDKAQSTDEKDPADTLTSALPSPEAIVNDKWLSLGSQQRQAIVVAHGRVFAAASAEDVNAKASARFVATDLRPNTTYTVFVTTETSVSGNASGVYGAVHTTNVTTFAEAPTIVKATVDPVADKTDSVVITANLSAPGVVHYYLSDVDFADPAVIRTVNSRSNDTSSDSDRDVKPHVVRGSFVVHLHDIAMEIINGTNDSRPVEPHMFVHNKTLAQLRRGATYHVSLTTETLDSCGVFGAFPPPIFVTTHLSAPSIVYEPKAGRRTVVTAVADSSTALTIELALSRFGSVHYAVFFRQLVKDRSSDVVDRIAAESRRLELEQPVDDTDDADNDTDDAKQGEPDALDASADTTNTTASPHVWPPPHSTFDLAHLSASLLKRAHYDELGPGVWANGTIDVSRDDILTGKRITKDISALPPNAVFDVCLVAETAGSDGIFDWEEGAPPTNACHRVQTHADYTNQSMLFDTIRVAPIDAQTHSVRIHVAMSKLLDAPARVFPLASVGHNNSSSESKNDAIMLERFAIATGRLPFFILADSKDARRDFAANAFATAANSNSHVSSTYDRSRDRPSPSFKLARAGSHHVAAAGMLTTVSGENGTHIELIHDVHELQANHLYYLFVAYETSKSDGVFTAVNPPMRRRLQGTDDATSFRTKRSGSNANDALEVTTHASAPTLTAFSAWPTFGTTARITLAFDVVCGSSCHKAIVYALLYPAACAKPPIDALATFPIDPDSDLEDASSVDSVGDSVEHAAARLALPSNSSTTNNCDAPLTKRRFIVDVGERDHKAIGVERDIFDPQLQPNTSYNVYFATETVNSSGVVSDAFHTAGVTTFAEASAFTLLRVVPRRGSTTELLLEFALAQPGEVHFLCGASGNSELNVTSPQNVSRKSRLGDKHRDAPKLPEYARDVVRLQRSIQVDRANERRTVMLDYLTAGTRYDVFVVAEAPASNGVYGNIQPFLEVATHANPPRLLAHAAFATPGSNASLTIGYRVDAPGVVHFSVVQRALWIDASHVAFNSDVYGNRLVVQEQLVAQRSVVVDEPHSETSDDDNDGWQEVNVSVPRAGANYTVYFVTETNGSDGVFGAVAAHRDVQSHRDPPTALKLVATPTDARVDALTVAVELTEPGHLHYIVLPHRERRVSEERDAAVAHGVVDVVANVTASLQEEDNGRVDTPQRFETTFLIAPLREGTVFDLYFRCETLASRGVYGAWTHFPISARTHGLPPDVLEGFECRVSPSCDALGREWCTREPNICGDCLEGFTGVEGSSNEPCRRLAGDALAQKKNPTIKISGVRINPQTSQASLASEPQMPSSQIVPDVEVVAAVTDAQLQAQKVTELSHELDTAAMDATASTARTGTNANDAVQAPSDGDVVRPVDANVADAIVTSASFDETTTATEAAPQPHSGVVACPPHAQMVAPGECVCMSGYVHNPATSTCELHVDGLSASSQFEQLDPNAQRPSDVALL